MYWKVLFRFAEQTDVFFFPVSFLFRLCMQFKEEYFDFINLILIQPEFIQANENSRQ